MSTPAIKNLLHAYSLANAEDHAEAFWYEQAHTECKVAAHRLGVKFKHFVWAVAALSPMCYWERNIQGVVELAQSGETGHGFRKNRDKALECLKGNLDALKGKKVTAFAKNLFNPLDHKDDVVVDQWAIRASLGVVAGAYPGLQPKVYDQIAEAYRVAANEVSLEPSEFQAIVWTVVRRLGKNWHTRKSQQTRRINRNKAAAVASGDNINAQDVDADILGKGLPGGDADHLQGTNK
jgi:hypothetical protein